MYVLLELWKIKKVVDIKVNNEHKILGIFPRISFADKGSYANSPTKEYDNVCNCFFVGKFIPFFD